MKQQLDHRSSQLDQMIQAQLVDRGIRDERVLAAMRAVPRDRFFRSEHRDEAYADSAAPIGHGQTISQPYIVALMTERLDIEPAHRVLEIGTGSGYQTAVLARLAAEVFTIERVKPLLDEAWERLMSLNVRNVHFRHGDGTEGWPAVGRTVEPFDRILIAAGAPEVPKELLLGQLKDGGMAVLPVGDRNDQTLVIVTRRGSELSSEPVIAVRFVRLIGREGWAEEDARRE